MLTSIVNNKFVFVNNIDAIPNVIHKTASLTDTSILRYVFKWKQETKEQHTKTKAETNQTNQPAATAARSPASSSTIPKLNGVPIADLIDGWPIGDDRNTCMLSRPLIDNVTGQPTIQILQWAVTLRVQYKCYNQLHWIPHVTKTNSEYGLDVVKDQHKIFPMTIPKHPIEICCTNTLEIIRKDTLQTETTWKTQLEMVTVPLSSPLYITADAALKSETKHTPFQTVFDAVTNVITNQSSRLSFISQNKPSSHRRTKCKSKYRRSTTKNPKETNTKEIHSYIDVLNCHGKSIVQHDCSITKTLTCASVVNHFSKCFGTRYCANMCLAERSDPTAITIVATNRKGYPPSKKLKGAMLIFNVFKVRRGNTTTVVLYIKWIGSLIRKCGRKMLDLAIEIGRIYAVSQKADGYCAVTNTLVEKSALLFWSGCGFSPHPDAALFLHAASVVGETASNHLNEIYEHSNIVGLPNIDQKQNIDNLPYLNCVSPETTTIETIGYIKMNEPFHSHSHKFNGMHLLKALEEYKFQDIYKELKKKEEQKVGDEEIDENGIKWRIVSATNRILNWQEIVTDNNETKNTEEGKVAEKKAASENDGEIQPGKEGWHNFVVEHVKKYGVYDVEWKGYKYTVKPSEGKGNGLFANQCFEKGQKLVEKYTGFGKVVVKVETKSPSKIKTKKLLKMHKAVHDTKVENASRLFDHGDYLLETDLVFDAFTQTVKSELIQPYNYPFGFTNGVHPECKSEAPNIIACDDGSFVCLKDIQKGEELIWDYGAHYWWNRLDQYHLNQTLRMHWSSEEETETEDNNGVTNNDSNGEIDDSSSVASEDTMQAKKHAQLSGYVTICNAGERVKQLKSQMTNLEIRDMSLKTMRLLCRGIKEKEIEVVREGEKKKESSTGCGSKKKGI